MFARRAPAERLFWPGRASPIASKLLATSPGEGAGCGSVGDVPGAWLASAPLWPSLWTYIRLTRGVRPRLKGKEKTPLSSRVATGMSWSPLSDQKGIWAPPPSLWVPPTPNCVYLGLEAALGQGWGVEQPHTAAEGSGHRWPLASSPAPLLPASSPEPAPKAVSALPFCQKEHGH